MKTLIKVASIIIFVFTMTLVSSCDYNESKEDYESAVLIHNANVEEGIHKGRIIEESFETACDTIQYYLNILDKFSDITDSKRLTKKSNSLYYEIKDESLIDNMRRLDWINDKVISLLNE